ncbi:MAG TPA: hypothetical protein PK390_06230 [Fervidobacterium nodosum]|nr:hypothetical protein [Fervidobacterium nodosum]
MMTDKRIAVKVKEGNNRNATLRITTHDIASFRLITERAEEPYVCTDNEIILHIRNTKRNEQACRGLYDLIKQLRSEGYKPHEVYPYIVYLAGKSILRDDTSGIAHLAYCEYITKEFALNQEYDPATRLVLAHKVSLALINMRAVVSIFIEEWEQDYEIQRKLFNTLADRLGIDKQMVTGRCRYFQNVDIIRLGVNGNASLIMYEYDKLGLAEKMLAADIVLEEDFETGLKLVKELMVNEQAKKLAEPLWILESEQKCAKILLFSALENVWRG